MRNSTQKRVIPREIERILVAISDSVESKYSSLIVKAIKTGCFDEVVNIYCDPNAYSSAHSYFRDQCIATLLKKCPDVPTTHNRREAAVKKWYEGEKACYESNLRLSKYLPEKTGSDSLGLVSEVISGIRKIVVELIGHSPAPHNTIRRLGLSEEVEEFMEGWFGPGATFSDRGRLTTAADKMSSNPSVTTSAYPFGVSNLIGTMWLKTLLQRGGGFEVVRGNRFTTVPKTAKTDRPIAAEPSINIYYQLAYGALLKRCLRKRGWDLMKAQEIHKQVARESSVDRRFCTIDLSNASDTVSKNLVKCLLPPAWFRALNSLRSENTLIDGRWVHLEKFSSMGNGFTFELETVIFAAISCYVSRHFGFPGRLGEDVFVFGDDIIVRDELFSEVKLCLEFFGFQLNAEKSFYGKSPFRESCGGDYFNGHDVRGVYINGFPKEPSDFIVLANQFHKVRNRFASFGDDPFLLAWLRTLDCLPTALRRLRGPASLGDIVIHDDDRSKWQTRYTFGSYKVPRNPWWKPTYQYPENVGLGNNKEIQAYVGTPLNYVKWSHFRPDIVLACAVLGVGDGREGILPRDPILSFKTKWVACP